MTVLVLVLGFIAGIFVTSLVLSLLEEKDEELHEAELARLQHNIDSLSDDLGASRRECRRLREQNGKLFDQWAQAHGWDRV